MGKVVCVANQKGGVGKTTTAVNLGTALARAGKATLLVDLDPQCHATRGLGLEPADRHALFTGERPLESRLHEHLSILPGSTNQTDMDRLEESPPSMEQMQAATDPYEYCVLDCPPSDGPLTEWALTWSDEVLMPVPCEYYSMDGVGPIVQLMRQEMARPENPLGFTGVLLTKVDAQFEWTARVDQELREFFGEIVFETTIPQDQAFAAARISGHPVIDHAPRSRGARAYVELCMEVLKR